MRNHLIVPEIGLSASLLTELERNNVCLFTVAYLSSSGIQLLVEAINRRLDDPRFSLSIVCCASDLITDPTALETLLALRRRRRGRLELRWHRSAGFHAKAYGFRATKHAPPTVFLGSMNLTSKALSADSGELGVALAASGLSAETWSTMESFWADGEDITPSGARAYRWAYERHRKKAAKADAEVQRWRSRFRRRRQPTVTRAIVGDRLYIEHGHAISAEGRRQVERAQAHAKQTYDVDIAPGWYAYDRRRDAFALPKDTDIMHVHWRSQGDASRGASHLRVVRVDRRVRLVDPETGVTIWLVYFAGIRGARAHWRAAKQSRATAELARQGMTWAQLHAMQGYLRGRRPAVLRALRGLKRLGG